MSETALALGVEIEVAYPFVRRRYAAHEWGEDANGAAEEEMIELAEVLP